jgi:hypothetical protein
VSSSDSDTDNHWKDYVFSITVGTKFIVLEILLNGWDLSSVNLPAEGTKYPQKCSRHTLAYYVHYTFMMIHVP